MKRRGRPALTPWFPGDVRPARPGVYQRGDTGLVSYSRWDGTRWFSSCLDRNIAAEATNLSIVQLPWRGRRYPA